MTETLMRRLKFIDANFTDELAVKKIPIVNAQNLTRSQREYRVR